MLLVCGNKLSFKDHDGDNNNSCGNVGGHILRKNGYITHTHRFYMMMMTKGK